jgi:hypothetical protein
MHKMLYFGKNCQFMGIMQVSYISDTEFHISHATLVGSSAGLLVTFWLAALLGSPFTVEQLFVSISVGGGNGPHHCQSNSDLTEMLANYAYKSKEVIYSEKYSVKEHYMYVHMSKCELFYD